MQEKNDSLADNETFYLSLGGNYADSLDRIKRSIRRLTAHPSISGLRHAHFYSTRPIEVNSDHWFINTVCAFDSTLTLYELFKFTQQVETEMGKIPKAKTVSRPIDIDILFMGEEGYCDDALEVPHPRWSQRLFVLIPLSDLISLVTYRVGKEKKQYDLQLLIDPLLKARPNDIFLLEENPILYTGC